MSAPPVIDEPALAELAALARAWTGFSPAAIHADAVRKAAEALLGESGSVAQLLHRARRREPSVVQGLLKAVSVGETYFFRQPEHFRFLRDWLIEISARPGAAAVSAWSAGCATGEEAFSLAATLLAASGPGARVLGTDLLERNVATARAGVYGSWSRRGSGPILHPLLAEAGPDKLSILPRVRALARFEPHHLLDAPPPGAFDVVLCRNVLVYFAPEAAQRALAHLAGAVAPGGLLIFGPLDAGATPEGFLRAAPAELQIFRRAQEERAAHASPPRARVAEKGPAPVDATEVATIASHTRALLLLERGASQAADELLALLSSTAPDYLPGLLERALLQLREGRHRAASALMRELLEKAAALEPDRLLPGPEPLPARFFSSAARAYLDREAP